MIKLFCGFVAIVLMGSVVAKATEPPGIEVRKRNAIGRMGLVRVQLTTKAEADGSMAVSFQAVEPGTYVLVYTSGRARGKTAATVKVEKPGPVSAKIRPSGG
jgi:hypothetical protein